MKLIFEKKAEDYIRQKQYSEIHIVATTSAGCCSGVTYTSVHPGPPKRERETYKTYQGQGITLHVPYYLEFKGKQILIGLDSFLGFKSLVVRNLDQGLS